MSKTVLVTGFSPFPGMPINPSALLIERLQKLMPGCVHGVRFHFELLPTTWAARKEVTDRLRKDLKPDAIVHIGVASKSYQLRIETRAVNQATRIIPDAAGKHAPSVHLSPEAPEKARFSTLPTRAMLEAALRSGAKAKLSNDAGTYLCNATLWDSIGSGIPSVFIHIPPLPRWRQDRRPPLTSTEQACRQMLLEIARRI